MARNPNPRPQTANGRGSFPHDPRTGSRIRGGQEGYDRDARAREDAFNKARQWRDETAQQGRATAREQAAIKAGADAAASNREHAQNKEMAQMQAQTQMAAEGRASARSAAQSKADFKNQMKSADDVQAHEDYLASKNRGHELRMAMMQQSASAKAGKQDALNRAADRDADLQKAMLGAYSQMASSASQAINMGQSDYRYW